MRFLKAAALLLALLVVADGMLQVAAFSLQRYYEWSRARNLGSGARILAIGESTTQGGLDPLDSYPGQLEAKLRELCGRSDITVVNRGIAGLDTRKLLGLLPLWLDEVQPGLVISMVGINDSAETPAWTEPARNGFWGHFRLYRIALWALQLYRHQRDLKADRPEYSQLFAQPLLNQGDLKKAEEEHKKVLATSPQHAWARLELGVIYRMQGRGKESEEELRRAWELKQENSWFHWQWALSVLESKGLPEFQRMVERRLELYPKEYWLASAYADTLKTRGGKAPSWVAAMAEKHDTGRLFPATKANYLQIARLVRESGAELLAMPYPRRDVKELMFLGENGARFFDSKPLFRKLEPLGYSKVFYDQFAGDFGHLTRFGNEQLGEALAEFLAAQNGFCESGRLP